ncbi:MAG: ABC transporter permease [Acidimicrobiaceae bacterium]|nr:ABC transporter permease [Acidimicrobiaceae bacterium]
MTTFDDETQDMSEPLSEYSTEMPPSDSSLAAEVAPKKKLGFGFWLSAFWVLLITLLAVLAPILPIKDPTENYIITETTENLRGDLVEKPVQPPYSLDGNHWMGTDKDARDMLSRTIFGARISLAVGFITAIFGLVVGGALGMFAGYFKGWVDRIISSVFIVSLSFPGLILAILVVALLNRSLWTISITIGILAVAPVGRLARAQTITFAEREFVIAAETLGAKRSRIILREMLPNVLIPMATLSMLVVAIAIVAEGALAFLGLSVQKSATWGKLILTGSDINSLESAPWIAFGPIIFLFFTVASLNYMSDRLRDFFDVREVYDLYD